LYDTHVALGARMVPFAGWEMPVQYSGALEEHETVRTAAGLFDIDHMGQIIVEGPDAFAFLQHVVTSNVSALAEWEAGYSILCYADGGTVDDIFIYNLPEHYFLAVNASNLAKDALWLRSHAAGYDVTVTDISVETFMMALQGPKAQDILQQVTDADLANLRFHFSTRADVAGIPTLIGNTGYTGEYGYELFFPADKAEKMWKAIMEAGLPHGLKPIGLAARDSLRFEPCLPLYGHELSPTLSPIEAGLTFAVKFDKGEFLGRQALLKQKLEGPERKLVGIEMVDKGVPREHYAIRVEDAEGIVTSGMFAPTLKAYLAMALLPAPYAKLDQEVEVIIRGKPKRAKVVRRPFYTPAYRR
jgi:aminomethyltransferase